MRYAFDSNAVSIINRVDSAAFNRTLRDYGSSDIRLLGMLWLEADLITDWGGESEHLLDIYPLLSSAERQLNALAFELIEARALTFENRLWLAICVVNAVNALEGSAGNVWNLELAQDRINEEFKKEREEIGRAIVAATTPE
jgi:hypothetical protein